MSRLCKSLKHEKWELHIKNDTWALLCKVNLQFSVQYNSLKRNCRPFCATRPGPRHLEDYTSGAQGNDTVRRHQLIAFIANQLGRLKRRLRPAPVIVKRDAMFVFMWITFDRLSVGLLPVWIHFEDFRNQFWISLMLLSVSFSFK